MFNLREFIKNGLLKAIGNLADYQIILNAAGWHEKGVLLEEDLALINNLIEEKNAEDFINLPVNPEISQEKIIGELSEGL